MADLVCAKEQNWILTAPLHTSDIRRFNVRFTFGRSEEMSHAFAEQTHLIVVWWDHSIILMKARFELTYWVWLMLQFTDTETMSESSSSECKSCYMTWPVTPIFLIGVAASEDNDLINALGKHLGAKLRTKAKSYLAFGMYVLITSWRAALPTATDANKTVGGKTLSSRHTGRPHTLGHWHGSLPCDLLYITTWPLTR